MSGNPPLPLIWVLTPYSCTRVSGAAPLKQGRDHDPLTTTLMSVDIRARALESPGLCPRTRGRDHGPLQLPLLP